MLETLNSFKSNSYYQESQFNFDSILFPKLQNELDNKLNTSGDKRKKLNFSRELLAEERLRSVRLFSEKIRDIWDISSMINAVSDVIKQDRMVEDVAVLKEGEKKAFVKKDEKGLNNLFLKPDHFDDHTLVVSSYAPFTNQDQEYFDILIQQTSNIQQNIRGLLKDPRLFLELHEILSRKKELLFIKSESGYSRIVDETRNPSKLIYLRLRGIKDYFDDNFLLQVHRSWLINPDKVQMAVKITNQKYELKIGDHSIPIGKSYIAKLKEKYPIWFA